MTKIRLYIIGLVLLAMSILSCGEPTKKITVLDENGTQNGLVLKDIISSNEIEKIVLIRPFGYSVDTTYYDLNEIEHLYGERLFTLGNEKFECRHLDSIVYVNKNSLSINYTISGYDNSGPFTQDFVSNYWSSGNGYFLNKKLPQFKGRSYLGGLVDLDSLVLNSEKTLLHFGWLSCKGCMVEQKEMAKLIEEKPQVKFVNITIDQPERLDKYLIDKGDYFELKAPYNRQAQSMIKPILLDDKENIFDFFQLKGLFPVNFLVDQSGKVEKIGSLTEIFKTEKDSIEIFTVY